MRSFVRKSASGWGWPAWSRMLAGRRGDYGPAGAGIMDPPARGSWTRRRGDRGPAGAGIMDPPARGLRTGAPGPIPIGRFRRSERGLPLDRAGPRPCGPHPRWRGRRGVAMRTSARMPRERPARMRIPLDPAVVVVRRRLVRLLLDRPPDDVDQSGERDLQGEHQPDESPSHGGRSYRDQTGMSRRDVSVLPERTYTRSAGRAVSSGAAKWTLCGGSRDRPNQEAHRFLAPARVS